MIPFPNKKYDVIYADPPWSYRLYNGTGNGPAAKHYKTMKPEEIYNLPVQDIAAENCILFLWVTFPNLEIGLETIRRWGFKYKTAAFVWVKRNKKIPWLVLGPGKLDQSKRQSLPYCNKRPPEARFESGP